VPINVENRPRALVSESICDITRRLAIGDEHRDMGVSKVMWSAGPAYGGDYRRVPMPAKRRSGLPFLEHSHVPGLVCSAI
jgi:hypothetical protein